MTKEPVPKMQIPVIDISDRNPHAPQQLLDAAMGIGFIFVADNDNIIPAPLIDSMFALSKQFFALPPETKDLVSIRSCKAGKNHGWLGQGIEKLDPATQKRPDVKEAFNLGLPTTTPTTWAQPLPALFTPHLTQLSTFQSACHALCTHILTLLARGLAMDDENWFAARHDRSAGQCSAVLRMLHYPAPASCSALPDHEDIRAGAHSDYGSVTCLFQLPGQPGLEIRMPGGEWAGVPVDPSADEEGGEGGGKGRRLPLLVNIGDLMEYWTGGMLRSTVHRVVFPGEGKGEEAKDRYSIAYFCQPLDDTRLVRVPSKAVEEFVRAHPREGGMGDGRVITADEHLMGRLAATYKVG